MPAKSLYPGGDAQAAANGAGPVTAFALSAPTETARALITNAALVDLIVAEAGNKFDDVLVSVKQQPEFMHETS